MIMQNAKTSLFCEGKCLTFFNGVTRYGIWRIMWQGKRCRIIIYADLPTQASDALEDGKTLELRYYENGRMDDPKGGIPIFQFKNIQLRRQWIPTPNPLKFDFGLLTRFSEYYCDIVEMGQGR